MSRMLLPDAADLESVVSDYFDTLLPEPHFTQERQQIIDRCVPAFEQLMNLVENVCASGKAEELLLAAFMRDLLLATTPRADDTREKFTNFTHPALH